MRFELRVDLSNAAFDTPFTGSHARSTKAVSDLLTALAKSIQDCAGYLKISDTGNIRDENGNTIGAWIITTGKEQ